MKDTGVAPRTRKAGFTLVELLVVVSVIGLLISILVPSLSAARKQARGALCLSNLHVLGQGIGIYTESNRDVLPPSRLPKIDDCNAYAVIRGGRKYRPTYLAVLGAAVGVPAFDDPQACKTDVDRFGEPGDQQDYSSGTYVCPAVSTWTDERNGSYGYNYQFLGNTRLLDSADPGSYKNWPVLITHVRFPGSTVAVADCMGTAASWPTLERGEYVGNSRDAERYGNEGFNLDPPRVDPVHGEMANLDASPQSRTAADPRHRKRANVLWLDAHVDARTPAKLGYAILPDGIVSLDGDNTAWSGAGLDVAWTTDSAP